ncbi:hypothetical protein FRB94_000371 [Tulasnella sp. JGI-2019a]|nr:hypothetical protein FRB94_000371 [Tulasnella sp. JGI-2019a]
MIFHLPFSGPPPGPLAPPNIFSLRPYSPSTTIAQGSTSTSPEKPPLQTPTPPKSDSDEGSFGHGSVVEEDGKWKRFAVLPSAPALNAFLDMRKGSAGQQSRMFMATESRKATGELRWCIGARGA